MESFLKLTGFIESVQGTCSWGVDFLWHPCHWYFNFRKFRLEAITMKCLHSLLIIELGQECWNMTPAVNTYVLLLYSWLYNWRGLYASCHRTGSWQNFFHLIIPGVVFGDSLCRKSEAIAVKFSHFRRHLWDLIAGFVLKGTQLTIRGHIMRREMHASFSDSHSSCHLQDCQFVVFSRKWK